MGPLLAATDNGTKKVWICLFTCAVTRAVHLELVEDLTTQSFLLCLRRFMAVFGQPKVIISDNGKYFKLANDVLKRLWSEICQSPELAGFLAKQEIHWKFITDYAPWMGGFYERLVGLAKRSLKKVLGRQQIGLEQLRTLVAEVAAILNSRPLVLSTDIRDQVLTPADLLGRRKQSGFPKLLLSNPQDKDYVNKNTLGLDLVQAWKDNERVLDQFWDSWRGEYLTALRERGAATGLKPGAVRQTVSQGTPVLIKEATSPRSLWKVGVVAHLITSGDGVVRSVSVRLPSGTHLIRPIKLLYPLEVGQTVHEESHDINTKTQAGTKNAEGSMCPTASRAHHAAADNMCQSAETTCRPTRIAAQRARKAIAKQLSKLSEDE
jgi:hypothetical protein